MECGKVQGKGARHFGCEMGRDAADALHNHLRDAWRRSNVEGLLHIMQDDHPADPYNALFMQEAMERAGIESRVIRSVAGLSWAADGGILDERGDRVCTVWKSWAWETALDQIRRECEDDERKLETYHPGERHEGDVGLVDVLLCSEVMVYEPLWTLIPSNKAILPVVWSLFPNHPFLLETSFELTDALRASGYVSKPIDGRCGDNIRLFDRTETLIDETGGQFGARDQIYQELLPLARAGDLYGQPST